MKRGTQIAYIPNHAKGDINDPDVEFGFVTSIRGDVAFCRYWHRDRPEELRTTANSEATSMDNLVEHNSKLQGLVDQLLRGLEE